MPYEKQYDLSEADWSKSNLELADIYKCSVSIVSRNRGIYSTPQTKTKIKAICESISDEDWISLSNKKLSVKYNISEASIKKYRPKEFNFRSLRYQKLKRIVESFGNELVSQEYKDTYTYYHIKCDKHGVFKKRYASIKPGRRKFLCDKCSKEDEYRKHIQFAGITSKTSKLDENKNKKAILAFFKVKGFWTIKLATSLSIQTMINYLRWNHNTQSVAVLYHKTGNLGDLYKIADDVFFEMKSFKCDRTNNFNAGFEKSSSYLKQRN